MFIDTSTWGKGQPLPLNFDVKARHPKYDEMLKFWQMCRDARTGVKAIKYGPNAETYLPRLDSQVIANKDSDKSPNEKNRQYENYKNRSVWYGATGQTVEAFNGMIYSTPPAFNDIPDDIKDSDLMKYASQNDESFLAFMKACTDEIFTVNRVGILEDYPVQLDEKGNIIEMSRLEYEKAGINSYSVMYKAEQVTNWGTAVHNGRNIENFYILEETWLDYSESVTKPKKRLRWRILQLEKQEDKSLRYKQITVKESTVDGKEAILIDDVFYPMINGEYFDYIPFWCLSVYGNTTDDVKDPEILDLVEMNLAHYRNSADDENEGHYVSIKTAIFPGWPVDDPNYGLPVLGGGLATPPDQTPFILEATSNATMTERLKAKEERMAILGAQMLASKGRYIQSAKTSEIENQGQSGILGSLSATIEEFFSVILQLKIEWSLNKESDARVVLNKEYMKNSVTPEMLKDLVAAVQAGKMSFKAFYYNVSKLGMYPDGWTEEQEQAAIENETLGAASMEIFTAIDTANKRLTALEGKKAEKTDEGAAA